MITTARTIIRPFTPDDAYAVLKLSQDAQITQYTGDSGRVNNIQDAENIINNIWLVEYQHYGYGRWAVVEKNSQQVIGFCGFKFQPELNMPDLGYRFLPSYWGQGLATETALACINYGQKQWQIRQFFADIQPANTASIKVIEKLGLEFQEEVITDNCRYWRYLSRLKKS